MYNFSRCIYAVNSKGSIGLSDEGAIILKVNVAAGVARFEVQQCWNFFVTRNHLENVLVDTINYTDNHSYF